VQEHAEASNGGWYWEVNRLSGHPVAHRCRSFDAFPLVGSKGDRLQRFASSGIAQQEAVVGIRLQTGLAPGEQMNQMAASAVTAENPQNYTRR